MAYQPSLADFARYQLDQLPPAVVDTLLDCIQDIAADPYSEPHLRVTLVIPLYRIFPDAYVCGLWAVAYTVVEGLDAVVIEAVGQTFLSLSAVVWAFLQHPLGCARSSGLLSACRAATGRVVRGRRLR